MATQLPLVSVIIPAYNRSQYLREAIAGAVAQTYRNIEIIVSDDASPDSPEPLVRSFNDPRIRFRRNVRNLGIGGNVTVACREAQGKYLAFLNDDDVWHPDFLEKLVPPLEANPDLVIAFSDHYLMDADGAIDFAATEQNTRRYKRDRLREGVYKPFIRMALLDLTVPAAMATVYRRDAIEWDVPPQASYNYDFYFMYLACRDGRGAYYCPERLTRYRSHGSSATAAVGMHLAGYFVHWYERFLQDERLRPFHPLFRKKLAQRNQTWGYALLSEGRLSEARGRLMAALRGGRLNPGLLTAILLSYTSPALVGGALATYRSIRSAL
ncbi:MAG: glycosyltransferase family 2 protein [Pseudomonadota bacterium]|uniref:glycosyltransferase family 2 protein n=1 Tax=Thermithiobacillus tepidarius TaxID=929 RepID=UPI00040E25B5|nr:glycosyltransferase family 2 protein [Thermithiobacillus tepidarius]